MHDGRIGGERLDGDDDGLFGDIDRMPDPAVDPSLFGEPGVSFEPEMSGALQGVGDSEAE